MRPAIRPPAIHPPEVKTSMRAKPGEPFSNTTRASPDALGVPLHRKGKGRPASNKLVRSRTEHQMRARVRGDSLNRSDSFRAFSPPVTTLGSPSNSKAEIPYVAASMVKVVKYPREATSAPPTR